MLYNYRVIRDSQDGPWVLEIQPTFRRGGWRIIKRWPGKPTHEEEREAVRHLRTELRAKEPYADLILWY